MNLIHCHRLLLSAAPVINVADWNAWHLVALGLGAGLAHAYHTIVQAGGIKTIWRNFWNGPASANPAPRT